MNKRLIAICAMYFAILLGCIYLAAKRSSVRYVDMPCPACGSIEVLDYGHNDMGEQRAHCYNCKQEFTINEEK